MNKVIVTTTINPPTEAIQRFSAMEGWKMVIAGDKKTPEEIRSVDEKDNCHYISPIMQERIDPKLSDAIGWNCIQRRNFAFLFACKELKADLVSTIDDDNIPKDTWGQTVFAGHEVECDEWSTPYDAFNPLTPTRYPELWHRGYPLELVRDKYKDQLTLRTKKVKCDVQADLWDGEADVDAICRLTHQTGDCFFKDHVPFTSDKPSPFNSQNTFLTREVMPHYFMFPGIGRLDDIAASYHVQAQGFRVVYGNATVRQERNDHNIVSDLLKETWGIENALSIVKEIPTNKNCVIDRLPERAKEAFRLYQKHFE